MAPEQTREERIQSNNPRPNRLGGRATIQIELPLSSSLIVAFYADFSLIAHAGSSDEATRFFRMRIPLDADSID